MKLLQYKLKKHSVSAQCGQAATEFVIAAVFVLVPLFLIIPLLGKYIDIKHAAIQQSRYEAWEYTVWSGPKEYVMKGLDDEQIVGAKDFADTRMEGLHYFFNDPLSNSVGQSESTLVINPNWIDHRGDSLFVHPRIKEIAKKNTQSEDKTPDPLAGVLDFVLTALDEIFKLFGEALRFFGIKAEFDAIYTRGYFKSEVDLEVYSIDDILPQYGLQQKTGIITTTPSHLNIKGRSAVLTNSWNAGGTDHAKQEVRGLLLTSLISPVSDTINTILYGIQKVVDLFPIHTVELPNLPDFGYVADDVIPFEHVKDSNIGLQEKHGLYYYEEKKK